MFRSRWLCASFFLGALFGKGIILRFFFLCVQVYCFFSSGSILSCCSLDWHQGCLLISRPSLHRGSFLGSAEEIRCSLRSRHLEIVRPKLALEAVEIWMRSENTSETFWTVSVQEGSLQGEKAWEGALFFYEPMQEEDAHGGRSAFGRFLLKKDQRVLLEITASGDRGGSVAWNADLHQFPGEFLQRWIDLRGVFNGRCSLVSLGRAAQSGSLFLTFSEAGYADCVDGAKGSLEWRGSFRNPLDDGRARLVLEKGRLGQEQGSIDALQGDFSFTARVGAQWQCSGVAGVQDRAIPLVWTGKAFFSSLRAPWIESEVRSQEASFHIQGSKEGEKYCGRWEARRIGPLEGLALRSLAAVFGKKWDSFDVDQGRLDAQGEVWLQDLQTYDWSVTAHLSDFSGRKGGCAMAFSSLQAAFSSEERGMFSLSDVSLSAQEASRFPLQVEHLHITGEIVQDRLENVSFRGVVDGSPLEGAFSGSREQFTLAGFFQGASIDLSGQCGEHWLFQAQGELAPGIRFFCPLLAWQDSSFCFDVRIGGDLLELARFYGTMSEGVCRLDPGRSRILDSCIEIGEGLWDQKGFFSAHGKTRISWNSFLAALPSWVLEKEAPLLLPMEGSALLDVSFDRENGVKLFVQGETLLFEKEPLALEAAIVKQEEGWRIAPISVGGWTLCGLLHREERTIALREAVLAGHGLEMFCEGTIDLAGGFDFHCSQLTLDLKKSAHWLRRIGAPIEGVEGILKGTGALFGKKQWQAAFSLQAESLRAASLHWRLLDPMEIHCDSEGGFRCAKVHFSANSGDRPLCFCKVEQVRLRQEEGLWGFYGAHVTIPRERMASPLFSIASSLELRADLECPLDFSFLRAQIPECNVPLDGGVFPIRSVSLYISEAEAKMRLQAFCQNIPFWIDASVACGANLSGTISLEEQDLPLSGERLPLSLLWESSKTSDFRLRAVEGQFRGVDASFHAIDEGYTLIGSARIHFREIAPFLPESIQEMIRELGLGKGYELKGKLSIDSDRNPSFCGLLTGKQIDLFGFRLRTLLSQVFFDAKNFRLWDCKISDSAAIIKIDELIAQGDGDRPWTISMPCLNLFELRPSLLQREGAQEAPSVKEAGPLVIKELSLENFKGLLEESRTYTAHGTLEFINSYRREHTIFDIPSDLLGRIIGLDFELLTPACGKISYDLKEGCFYLTALENAFSEGKRSEFFLVQDPLPVMDLDGNLSISVSMKQFVLFKFTELFQIYIDGTLSDPKFHLRKKRRFLG